MVKKKSSSLLIPPLAYFFLVILFIFMFVFVYSSMTPQNTQSKAAAATTLEFTPAQKQTLEGETISFDVVVNTGTNLLQQVAMNIGYDPTKLEFLSITNTQLFQNPLNQPQVSNGNIYFIVATLSPSQPFQGKGAVAVVKFKVLAISPDTTDVTFNPGTAAYSLTESTGNVLVGTTPAQVTIGTVPEFSPTNTPVPTPTIKSRGKPDPKPTKAPPGKNK